MGLFDFLKKNKKQEPPKPVQSKPAPASSPSGSRGSGPLLVYLDIDKLGGGAYGFAAGEAIAKVFPAAKAEGISVSSGDSNATLRGSANEYVVALKGNDSQLNEAEDMLRADEELTGLLSRTGIRRGFSSEPLCSDGWVKGGLLVGADSFCTAGFNKVWKKMLESKKPEPLPEAKISDLAAAQKNDHILFGSYPQSADPEAPAQPIEWRVLARENGRVLAISAYGLDALPYHSQAEEIDWEGCTLRKWLNGEFLNRAFTEEERAKIPAVKVPAEEVSPDADSEKGNDTEDRVFLLSYPELKQYMDAGRYFDTDHGGDAPSGYGKPTPYAAPKTSPYHRMGSSEFGKRWEGNCSWWLRSHYPTMWRQPFVRPEGSYDHCYGVTQETVMIRPCIWIETKE